jgi:hypothetical protein
MHFENDGQGEPKRIEFTGHDPSMALTIAQRENTGRSIALFEGEIKLGTIKRLSPELWQLG